MDEEKDNNEMNITVSCGAVCWQKPFHHVIEFWGYCGMMFFAAIRPEGQTDEYGGASPFWEEKDLRLFMGKVNKPEDIIMKPKQKIGVVMAPIEVLKVEKSKQPGRKKDRHGDFYDVNDRTLTIETVQGIFYLPDGWAREGEIPTFNGKPAEYLSS